MSGCIHVSLLIMLVIMAMNDPFVNARPKVHVHVVNMLSGKYILNIHCYWKDDDLGQHKLPVNGHLDWSFRASIFGDTVFNCDMEWAHGHGVFRVYWQDVELQGMCHTTNCIWLAANDGLYLKDFRINKFVLMYQWLI